MGFGAMFAATAALMACGTGGGDLRAWLLLTPLLWPAGVCLALVIRYGCCFLADRLLRWGLEPKSVRQAGLLLAGGLTLGALAPAVGKVGWSAVAWAAVAAGLVLAGFAGAWLASGLASVFRQPANPSVLLNRLRVAWLIFVAAGLAAFAWPQHHTALPPQDVEISEVPALRLAVIGVDGFSRETLEVSAQMLGGYWKEVGMWSWAPLARSQAQLPGEFWTTVACGAPPSMHGVQVFEESRPFGATAGVALSPWGSAVLGKPWEWLGILPRAARPILERKLPTFWEMAAEVGFPVTVGGWWGTWPVRNFPGQVISERAWLSGATGEDAVTAPLVPLVEKAFTSAREPAWRVTALAEVLAERAGNAPGPQLFVLAFQSLDLEARRKSSPALVLAASQLPHLRVLGKMLEGLRTKGFLIFLVGADWQGGTGFFAFSQEKRGPARVLELEEIAPAILATLRLPLAAYHPLPPPFLVSFRDWFRRGNYGPPPTVLRIPSGEAARLQRQVLQNLGYFQ
ncbi:MAG: hypothetical protein ACUVRQ_05350 [Thermoanaerobaculaceae bacterium]